jgi:hypothetical protein
MVGKVRSRGSSQASRSAESGMRSPPQTRTGSWKVTPKARRRQAQSSSATMRRNFCQQSLLGRALQLQADYSATADLNTASAAPPTVYRPGGAHVPVRGQRAKERHTARMPG